MLMQEVLEQMAARRPEVEALAMGAQRLSYGALDAAANQMAHLLRAHGVRRGDRVAVLLENSIETAVAIYGILKADAVFLVLHSRPNASGWRPSWTTSNRSR